MKFPVGLDLSAVTVGLPSSSEAPSGCSTVPPPIRGLVYRPSVRSRNAVRYVTVRCWSADAKAVDIAWLRKVKAAETIHADVVDSAAQEVCGLLSAMLGPVVGWEVTQVATGHSRRPDAFGALLATRAASILGVGFRKVFEDRYVSGVSHPKEFARLPPLTVIDRPSAPTILVDDVATSGWHMEEALGRLRDMGVPALGIAWIGGTVR